LSSPIHYGSEISVLVIQVVFNACICIPKNSKRYKNEKWKDVQFLAEFVVQMISSGSETVLNEMYTTIH
jgi:hypothetical protein